MDVKDLNDHVEVNVYDVVVDVHAGVDVDVM